MPSNEQDENFQSSIGKVPGYICGRGYMAKPSKSLVIAELSSQVHAQTKENQALNEKVDRLVHVIDAERVERDRVIAQQVEERVQEARQSIRDEVMSVIFSLNRKEQVYL